jgi:glyoxylase-like metal-dependent hydrolase (beta-lactamase superfamily II)
MPRRRFGTIHDASCRAAKLYIDEGRFFMKEYTPQYKITKLYEDTYAIADKGTGLGTVYMYLLVGAEKALLIDSGYGLLDLKAIVRGITDKEVICALSHGHIDHALGARQFRETYMHSLDSEVYRRHTSSEFIRMVGEKGVMMPPSKKQIANAGYQELIEQMAQADYPLPRALEDAAYFDLGGRIVRWRHIPGHTPGSVGFLDEKHNLMFDADGAPFGLFLFLPESAPLGEYIKTLEDYIRFLNDRNVAARYAGHMKRPLRASSARKLLNCCKAAEKTSKGKVLHTAFGDARMIFARGSMILCRRQI